MLGAIYSGLSGMNAFSNGLQAISNNVANLNTLGYKSTTVSFEDVFTSGGFGGLTFSGAPLDEQVGEGVRLASPAIDFNQGTLQQSGNALDLAIQGTGFLALSENGAQVYSRTGSFSVDPDGFIVLQGTQARLQVLDANGQPQTVNVDTTANQQNSPVATSKITLTGNLSSSATSDTVSNIKVFDSNGAQHTWQVALAVDATTPGKWNVTVTDETGATVGTGSISFTNGTPDPSASSITITTTPTGAAPLSIALDFSGATSFSSGTTSSLQASQVDGNAAGTLSSVTIDSAGNVLLTYSNSKTKTLGAVAIADFRDPQQLVRIGNGLYRSQGIGEQRLLASGQNGIGTLVSQQLESSNVNLSAEFGQLILIQRGFQASSQVVSIANDMIQQLFGMRGQG